MSIPTPLSRSSSTINRAVAACPWCGGGTALAPIGDGMGNIVLSCTACGGKGPPMPITGEFDLADDAAIARWSIRNPATRLGPQAIDRIKRAFALQTMLHGEPGGDASMSIRAGDLMQLLDAANVRLA